MKKIKAKHLVFMVKGLEEDNHKIVFRYQTRDNNEEFIAIQGENKETK